MRQLLTRMRLMLVDPRRPGSGPGLQIVPIRSPRFERSSPAASMEHPAASKKIIGTLERIDDEIVIRIPASTPSDQAEGLCLALIKGVFPVSAKVPG